MQLDWRKKKFFFSYGGWFNALHHKISMQILHNVLHAFSKGADKENLFNIQEILHLVIISFTHVTYKSDSGATL